MNPDSLEQLNQRVLRFARERDWEQFHSPKNLAMALTVEAGELSEQFQWLTEEESRDLDEKARERVAEELADVQIYLIRLADQLGIDLVEAAEKKVAQNAEKYPADVVRGSSRKYSEY